MEPSTPSVTFQREVGKTVTLRFRDPQADPRRVQGVLTAATDTDATLVLDDGTERTVEIAGVDKARTVFEWGPKPKPGKGPSGKKKQQKQTTEKKETQAS